MPFITTAAYQAMGSLGYALTYPIAVPAVCFVLGLFLTPETHKMSIWEPETVRQQGPRTSFEEVEAMYTG